MHQSEHIRSEGNFGSHFSPSALLEAPTYSKQAGPGASGQSLISVWECWGDRCTAAHETVLFFTDVGQLSLGWQGSTPRDFSHWAISQSPRTSPSDTLVSVRATLHSFLLPACPLGMLPAQNVLSSSVMSYLEAALVLNWIDLNVSCQLSIFTLDLKEQWIN